MHVELTVKMEGSNGEATLTLSGEVEDGGSFIYSIHKIAEDTIEPEKKEKK